MAILEPGITKCAFKECDVVIKPEFGYTKAINFETKKEEFFCYGECYRKHIEVTQNINGSFFSSK